ncbi:Uncharacterised protein [uncultured archaeon]|nr:Uncharacterised protein [uncultured archaeon]
MAEEYPAEKKVEAEEVKMSSKNIVLFAIVAFFVTVSIAHAAVTVPANIRYREISSSGVVNDTAIPVTGASAIGFLCSSANCSTVSSGLDISSGSLADVSNPPVLSAGSSSNMNITYPTTLQSSFGYGVYIYKDGYIPYEVKANWSGSGTASARTYYLAKKKSCTAPIMNFTVLNDVYKNIPLVIDMNATLDADTFAAIKSAGPLEYAPPLLDPHYSVNTSVTLVIKNGNGDMVNTNTTYMLIPYSGSKHVRFIWTPTTEGTYTASVTTGVPDAKCVQDSVIPQTQLKVFKVWATAPKNACYTLINGLSYSAPHPKANEPLTFTFNKISNYANSYDIWDPNYNLAPVKTRATYLITNSTGDTVMVQPLVSLPANPDNSTPATFNFTWTPAVAGNYTALISGTADDVRCFTVSNPQETATTTLRVSENVADTTPPVVNITYPADGQALPVGNITVTGTASDNTGLDTVQARLGTGDWQSVSGTTSWSMPVTLVPGLNTIYARANDTSGNSKEISITVNASTSASNTTNITNTTQNGTLHDVSLNGISIALNVSAAGSLASVSTNLKNKVSTSEENVPVVFLVDNATTETKYFNLSAQETKTVGFNWTAVAGNHTLTLFANLTNDSFPGDNIVAGNVSIDPAQQQVSTPSGSTGSSGSGGGGGGGGGGGSYTLTSSGDNKNAYFSNMSVPDSINSGDVLAISGCVAKLNKNSTVDVYLDTVLKGSEAVTVPAPCFNYSQVLSAAGNHLVYLWFNDSGSDFSKSINVVTKESASMQAADNSGAGAKILDISPNESARVNVPVALRVSVRVLKPGEASLILFADNVEVGRKQTLISGDAVFTFVYKFNSSGTKTLRAVVQTKGGEDSLLKKIEVTDGMPTGNLLLKAAQNPGVIATAIGAILAGGYYALRKGYLSALKGFLSALKWW